MNVLDRVLALTTETLGELESGQSKLSAILRKSMRIARLRNDYENLWWLHLEMSSVDNKDAQRRIAFEIAPHYTEDEFNDLKARQIFAYFDERSCRTLDSKGQLKDEKKISPQSVEELEDRLHYFQTTADSSVPPPGLHPVDLYFVDREKGSLRALASAMAQDLRSILSKIRQRTHDFLSLTEKQLIYGQVNSDIFEQNRKYVDLRLSQIAPEALEKFLVVYRRMGEEDEEARSHALTTCRRILEALADNVYPATETKVKGPDGKEHLLTQDKYISRLWQFVADRAAKKTSGKLLLSQIADIGNRIDNANALACKGVHSEVSGFEVNQCVIQTYLTVGDILRLHDQTSALESVEHEDPAI